MAIYPTAIATDADLHIQANDLEAKTTIDGAHTAIITTITVLSTTGFSAFGVFTVVAAGGSKERIKYTGKTATTFTGCTRGYDGSTAMALAGAETVNGRIVAAHHNVLKDEIIAIQTALGANPQNITTATNFRANSLGVGVAASGTAGRLTVNENLIVSGVGPHAIGGGSDVNQALRIAGSYTGTAAFQGVMLTQTLNAVANNDAYGLRNNTAIVEAGSGVHALLSLNLFGGSITGGAATTTDVVNIDVQSINAATGTTNATSLRVAAPIGATNNFIQSWLTALGTSVAVLGVNSTRYSLVFKTIDWGNNIAGSGIELGRNSNAGVEGPSASAYGMMQAGGGSAFIWSDNTTAPGVLRIHTAAPTGSAGTPTVSDTAGTVVGSQTSWHELKENFVPSTIEDYRMALQTILDTPLEWFTLKADGRRRLGYVIYEKDRGAWFSYNDGRQQVPALDERNLFGYHAASIKAIAHRLDVLEARVSQLGAR